MKKLIYAVLLAMLSPVALSSCLNDDDEPDSEWRERNDNFLLEMAAKTDADGSPYFTKITPDWNPKAYVLMRWHNDRSLTAKNISPISTSTVDVKYHLRNIDGEPKDSSYLRTSPADSIYRTRVNSNIEGWIIGIPQMHVGDSVTLIIPYQQGYGSTDRVDIKAYSTLIFDVKLAAVPGYETQVP